MSCRKSIFHRGKWRVLQRFCRELSVALDRVRRPAHVKGSVIERAQRLARAAPVEAEAPARGETADQRALQQTLRVDDGVVAARLESGSHRTDLIPGRAVRQLPTPAPRCDRNDLSHCWVQGWDLGEVFFYRPVDLQIRIPAPQIRHHWQVVYDIPER